MPNIIFDIVGVDKVKRDAKLLTQRFRNEIVEAMGRTATIIESEAKLILTRNKHVKTGNLRRSIRNKAGWASTYDIVGVIGCGDEAPYAPFIEALPDGGFLLPALLTKSAIAMKYLQDSVKKIIERD